MVLTRPCRFLRLLTESDGQYAGIEREMKKDANMDITRSGSQPSGKGPAEWFTGSVRIDSPFQRSSPARVSGAIVTFRAGRPHCMAHASPWSDAHRHIRSGTRAAGRRHHR